MWFSVSPPIVKQKTMRTHCVCHWHFALSVSIVTSMNYDFFILYQICRLLSLVSICFSKLVLLPNISSTADTCKCSFTKILMLSCPASKSLVVLRDWSMIMHTKRMMPKCFADHAFFLLWFGPMFRTIEPHTWKQIYSGYLCSSHWIQLLCERPYYRNTSILDCFLFLFKRTDEHSKHMVPIHAICLVFQIPLHSNATRIVK